MRQRSVGQRVWRLFTPLMMRAGITFLVEILIILVQFILGMTEDFLNYTTEVSALTAVCTIPVLVWMFRKDRREESLYGMEQPEKVKAGYYLLIAGISIPFALTMNNLLILSNLTNMSERYRQAAEVLYAPSLPVQILCIGIIIPIMEELIFRGLIYRRIRETKAALPAVIGSAVLFGLYHGNLVQMIYGFVCGLLLAYVYEKFGSLKAPVLMHILMNIFVCVLSAVGGFAWMFQQTDRLGIITVLCVIVSAGMLKVLQKC